MATMSDPFRSFLQTRQEISSPALQTTPTGLGPIVYSHRDATREQQLLTKTQRAHFSATYHQNPEPERGARLKEELDGDMDPLLLLSKVDTSLVSAPGGPAENKECRHTETTTHPQHQQWGHKGHCHSCQCPPQHTPGYTNSCVTSVPATSQC